MGTADIPGTSVVAILSVLVPVLAAAVAGWFALRQARAAAEAERVGAQQLPAAYDQLVRTQSEQLAKAYDRIGDVEAEQIRCRERQDQLEDSLTAALRYVQALLRWIAEHNLPGTPPPPGPPTGPQLLPPPP